MKPVQNYVEKYMQLCESMGDNVILENFSAMQRWAKDAIPVAGETFREFVKMVYQQNRLVRGEIVLGDQSVKLDQISCTVLMLVAENDHLMPPNSTLALKDCVSSEMLETMSIDAGHIGSAVSSKAQRELWPNAATWIGEQPTQIG